MSAPSLAMQLKVQVAVKLKYPPPPSACALLTHAHTSSTRAHATRSISRWALGFKCASLRVRSADAAQAVTALS